MSIFSFTIIMVGVYRKNWFSLIEVLILSSLKTKKERL
ncbi:MAG: hypothetical protein ACJAVX_004044, partial [Pseudoalteromonas rhizosphaerae]